MKNKAMEQRLNDEILEFVNSRKSLQLATLGQDNLPFASYAPFAIKGDSLYVLLSDIAVHGLNLLREPQASVLLIEDEDTAEELFARVRVNYRITAQAPSPDSPDWDEGIRCLTDRLGTRPAKLAQLADFHLFQLFPESGRYVQGFGKAYALTGGTLANAEILHLQEGHRARA